ncbi:hypothetical protein [Psychromicrobium xiongbiense]|uniref:hypothetical protein n=1 Tax=Psychromicrobium xiongbiense TaxID=3051184 RepID=UPI0025565AB0|nr:hypothetical protein [Psychromicrobium sp. YIM S02556]
MGSFSAQPHPGELCRIGKLPERGRAVCRGYISSITIQPGNAAPTFTAVVTDVDKYAPTDEVEKTAKAVQPGTPSADAERPRNENRLRLIWLGQRTVPGIEAGTEVRLEGMVAPRDGLPTMFNPRYEIVGKPEFQEIEK